MSFIQRYMAGACEAVWAELVSIGPDVRHSTHAEDAMQVAVETMTRVRTNLTLLRTRLETVGYRFGYYPDGTKLKYYRGPLVSPTPELVRQVEDLIEKSGPIPLALETFWRIVGSVDFIGQHHSWPKYADPIVIESPEASLLDYAEWQACAQLDGAEETGPFLAPIAPDDFHKDNVSGGPPYGFTLPNGAADAILEDEWHKLPFVAYLREAILGWGGFPGLSRTERPLPSKILDLRGNLHRF